MEVLPGAVLILMLSWGSMVQVESLSSENEGNTVNPNCTLPCEVGLCKAAFPRWYYDSSKRSCQEFIYGGCGGNANNFESLSDCENGCGAGSEEVQESGEANLQVQDPAEAFNVLVEQGIEPEAVKEFSSPFKRGQHILPSLLSHGGRQNAGVKMSKAEQTAETYKKFDRVDVHPWDFRQFFTAGGRLKRDVPSEPRGNQEDESKDMDKEMGKIFDNPRNVPGGADTNVLISSGKPVVSSKKSAMAAKVAETTTTSSSKLTTTLSPTTTASTTTSASTSVSGETATASTTSSLESTSKRTAMVMAGAKSNSTTTVAAAETTKAAVAKSNSTTTVAAAETTKAAVAKSNSTTTVAAAETTKAAVEKTNSTTTVAAAETTTTSTIPSTTSLPSSTTEKTATSTSTSSVTPTSTTPTTSLAETTTYATTTTTAEVSSTSVVWDPAAADDNNNPEKDSGDQPWSHDQNHGLQSRNNNNYKLRDHTSSHFAAFFLSSIVLVFAIYIAYHNRQKIIAVIIEGRSDGRRRVGNYKKLEANVEEAMPSMRSTSTAYVY